MIRPAAVPALPVEVQNAVVIGIGHNVTRRPRTNHKIPNLCATVVLHTMSDWITGFECCGVARTHNDAVVAFVKSDLAFKYINHLVLPRMPVLNRRRRPRRQDFFKSTKLRQAPAVAKQKRSVWTTRIPFAITAVGFGGFLAEHWHHSLSRNSFVFDSIIICNLGSYALLLE